MSNALIVHSSNYGQTARIARVISDVLEAGGHTARLADVTEARPLDLAGFDSIIVGGSIRYGRHSRLLTAFATDNRRLLMSRRSHFFSVSAVARRPEKSTPTSNPYVAPFLASAGWVPDGIAVFAGMIDYSLYGFIDRTLIKLIMALTEGPTDARTAAEFTDWSAVRSFANTICADMTANASATTSRDASRDQAWSHLACRYQRP